MPYTVYILRFSDNALYIGQTNNTEQRIRDHKNKASRSSKFSKDNGEFKLVYQENYPTQLEAMRREKQLKGWIRAKKEALISGNLELLKRLCSLEQSRPCPSAFFYAQFLYQTILNLK